MSFGIEDWCHFSVVVTGVDLQTTGVALYTDNMYTCCLFCHIDTERVNMSVCWILDKVRPLLIRWVWRKQLIQLHGAELILKSIKHMTWKRNKTYNTNDNKRWFLSRSLYGYHSWMKNLISLFGNLGYFWTLHFKQ